MWYGILLFSGTWQQTDELLQKIISVSDSGRQGILGG